MHTKKVRNEGSFFFQVSSGDNDPTRSAAEFGLKLILGALNYRGGERMAPEIHARLLRTVRSWLEAGLDLTKMKTWSGDPSLEQMVESFGGLLIQTEPGKAVLVSVPERLPSRTLDLATNFFMHLILNPLCDHLGSPCLNCGLWYIRKTLHKSSFCSRGCAAKRKLARRRYSARQKKLERAQAAVDNFERRPGKWRNLTLKDWVVQAEPDISSNFLTIAFRTGELNLPLKRA